MAVDRYATFTHAMPVTHKPIYAIYMTLYHQLRIVITISVVVAASTAKIATA